MYDAQSPTKFGQLIFQEDMAEALHLHFNTGILR